MARNRTCDNCGADITEENPVIAKLLLLPVDRNGKKQWRGGAYTAHMDVGLCCGPTLIRGKAWQKRKSVPSRGKRVA